MVFWNCRYSRRATMRCRTPRLGLHFLHARGLCYSTLAYFIIQWLYCTHPASFETQVQVQARLLGVAFVSPAERTIRAKKTITFFLWPAASSAQLPCVDPGRVNTRFAYGTVPQKRAYCYTYGRLATSAPLIQGRTGRHVGSEEAN